MASKKRNAFLVFMLERKPQCEKDLKRKINLNELSRMLNREWEMLSLEEKQVYKDRSKDEPMKPRVKCDSRGFPLSELLKENENERRELLKMQKDIKYTVEVLKSGNALSTDCFFVICISHYVLLDDYSYVPAELGVCQFSFKKGLFEDFFHKILPAEIPPGYRHEALQHSEQTHQLINITAKKCDIKNELCHYLLKGKSKLPNVYTENAYMESVKSMLVKLNLDINVYSLDYLYQHLYSACRHTDIPEPIARDYLVSSEYIYSQNMACDWHETMAPDASLHCSLSIVRRWIFNMCLFIDLKGTFGIIPVKGFHCPKNVSLSSSVESQPEDNKEHLYTEYDNDEFKNPRLGRFSEDDDDKLGAVGIRTVKMIEKMKLDCNKLKSFGDCNKLKGFGRGTRPRSEL